MKIWHPFCCKKCTKISGIFLQQYTNFQGFTENPLQPVRECAMFYLQQRKRYR